MLGSDQTKLNRGHTTVWNFKSKSELKLCLREADTGHHHGLPLNTCNIRWVREREGEREGEERVHRKQHTNVKPTSVCAFVHVHFTSCVHNSQNWCSHHCTGLGFRTIFTQWETFLKHALVRATCLLLAKFTLYLSNQNHLCSRWVENSDTHFNLSDAMPPFRTVLCSFQIAEPIF